MFSIGDTTFQARVHNFNATLLLYDGYDWARTRKIIEEKAKEMRRRLAKIRQLVASGQTPDPSVEETNALLFNSVYIGLEHNVDELEPGALIAAIDEELNEEFAKLRPAGMWQPGTDPNGPKVAATASEEYFREARNAMAAFEDLDFVFQSPSEPEEEYSSGE